MKFVSAPARSSSSISRRRFLSATRLHKFVVKCRPLRALCDTNMSHWGHLGYGRFPSSRITIFLACGGVQSEPGGWSDSSPLPGNPPPGIRAATDVSVNRPGKFGPTREGGGGFPHSPRPTPCWLLWYVSSEPAKTFNPLTGN